MTLARDIQDIASYPGSKIGPGTYSVRIRESTGQKLAKVSKS